MPFYPERAQGKSFSAEEILTDLGIDDPREFRITVLKKCELLYSLAKSEWRLDKFSTPFEFIVCKSSQFFQTLVNLWYGNSALVISDDIGSDVYFLLFSDKVPKQFRSIVAIHEATEYKLLLEGTEQAEAHQLASRKEIELATELNLLQDYLSFLKLNYPLKLEEIEELMNK